ncbi:MAG: sulfatase-like hydrolase/transferase [Myxococcota bacterium]|nr:sulfatase-like hydrolase/transferase [Myxococcota bacterium]
MAFLVLGCGSEPEPIEAGCRGPSCVEVSSEGDPGLVLFVVMDTVRASSLSLCGYEHPTSPFLDSMAQAGAAWSCNAQTPSSWTIPSHASFFTGLNVFEHGSHRDGESVLPLSAEANTLAERFSSQGYDTVCISANSFVSEVSGLTQGCDFVRQGGRNLTGGEVVQTLRDVLAERVPGEKPLYVFLNFYDAHTPWQPIPKGVGWVGARALPENDAALRWSFMRGEMEARTAQGYLEHIGDLYDYGVYLEDRFFGEAFEVLRTEGFMAGGVRVVVTSDHGELMGEHGMLNHGKTLYEPITRVPLVYWERPERSGVRLPSDSFSATSSFHLALEGRYVPVRAMAVDLPFPYWAKNTGGKVGNETWFAQWEGSSKTVWEDGSARQFDLAVDPMEAVPRHVEASLPVQFKSILEQEAVAPPPDEMLEMLKALGYAE